MRTWIQWLYLLLGWVGMGMTGGSTIVGLACRRADTVGKGLVAMAAAMTMACPSLFLELLLV